MILLYLKTVGAQVKLCKTIYDSKYRSKSKWCYFFSMCQQHQHWYKNLPKTVEVYDNIVKIVYVILLYNVDQGLQGHQFNLGL